MGDTEETLTEKQDPETLPEQPAVNPSDDMPRSRLTKSSVRNSQRTLILSVLGIIVIITLIVIFGVPFLEKLSQLSVNNNSATSSKQTDEMVILTPPDLTPPFEATNSANVTVIGTAADGDTVKLYENGKLADEAKIQSDNSFSFDNITLKEGTNTFTAKVFKENNESKSSDPITISYLKSAPKLSVDYPQEGQTIGNKDGDRLGVSGTTDPDVKVTINGSQAVVNENGQFKYVLPVTHGDNTIKAIATDAAGNTTEVDRKFSYAP